MNTHEQFIAPETARLAKQAGFDWECTTYYIEEYNPSVDAYCGEYRFNEMRGMVYPNPNDAEHHDFYFKKGTMFEHKVETFSAPTQAVLQRWLREVKNMRLTVLPWIGRNDKTEWSYITGRFYDQIKLSRAIGNEYSFDTYEAALEAGLQKCLTLIIEKQ